MLDQAKVFERIKSLLSSQHFGVLATRGTEYPYCTLVGYAASPGCEEIVFATIRETRKYQNLKKNPKVSLLVDTQTNQISDYQNAETLNVLGSAVEAEEASVNDYLELYLKKHPHLREFVTAPNCVLVVIKVSKYIIVNNFQNVIEYTMI